MTPHKVSQFIRYIALLHSNSSVTDTSMAFARNLPASSASSTSRIPTAPHVPSGAPVQPWCIEFVAHCLKRVVDKSSLRAKPLFRHLNPRQNRYLSAHRFAEFKERQRERRLERGNASVSELGPKFHDHRRLRRPRRPVRRAFLLVRRGIRCAPRRVGRPSPRGKLPVFAGRWRMQYFSPSDIVASHLWHIATCCPPAHTAYALRLVVSP